MDTKATSLQHYFAGWQCRLRQQAIRKDDGRPSSGMQAELYVKVSDKDLGPLNTVMVQRDSEELTSEFRHIVRKTFDPNIRQQTAIKLLGSAYYQYPKDFDEQLTATFLQDSELAGLLVELKECDLVFRQYQQSFRLHCAIAELDESDSAYQATYWHNSMFNATMPAYVRVLGFIPDWEASSADPPDPRG